jgi:hypothetical protein
MPNTTVYSAGPLKARPARTVRGSGPGAARGDGSLLA